MPQEVVSDTGDDYSIVSPLGITAVCDTNTEGIAFGKRTYRLSIIFFVMVQAYTLTTDTTRGHHHTYGLLQRRLQSGLTSPFSDLDCINSGKVALCLLCHHGPRPQFNVEGK